MSTDSACLRCKFTVCQLFAITGPFLCLFTFLLFDAAYRPRSAKPTTLSTEILQSIDEIFQNDEILFLSKHFPLPTNHSFDSVLCKLTLEQNLLKSDFHLITSKVEKHRRLQRPNLDIFSNSSHSDSVFSARYQDQINGKLLLILWATKKLFLDLYGIVDGPTHISPYPVHYSIVPTSVSITDLGQRREESSIINRLLSAKVSEIAQIHARWREREANKVEEDFHSRLCQIQDPPDCVKAKKLVCDIDREACGLGCQLHYGITCLAASLALNRTTILRLYRWGYTTNKWEDYFVPPSPKCQWTPVPDRLVVWRNSSHDAETTVLYPLDVFALQYYKPFRIAKSYAERLSYFHGRPWIWWIGQLLVTLFRVQPDFVELYRKRAKFMGFVSPVVGIHVRRSDKTASEARPYDLEKYMDFVEEYYKKLEVIQPAPQRRVYLATDDPYVYTEFRMKYPHYILLHNQVAAKSSARKRTRRTEDSLRGIMLDMYFLAMTDHIVCTMSSNVCRIVYALMQARYPDASTRYDSVDVEYIYVGSNIHYHRAVQSGRAGAGTSLDFEVGDRIEIKKTFWNGTSSGLLEKGIDQRGSFPAHKFVEEVETY